MADRVETPAILAFPNREDQIALIRFRYAATHPPGVVAHALSIRAGKQCIALVEDFLPHDARADADELFRGIIEAVLIEFRSYYKPP